MRKLNQFRPLWSGVIRSSFFSILVFSSYLHSSWASPAKIKPSSPQRSHGAMDPSALNPKIDPCQNFYQYSCGGWIARTEIPEDRAQWSRGFAEIDERNLQLLKEVLTGSEKLQSTSSSSINQPDLKKLRDFYFSCMQEQSAETEGFALLQKWMKRIDEWKDRAALLSWVAQLHQIGVDCFFSFYPEQDLKDPSQMIASADQGGLGLPDRQYYLSADPKKIQIREAYQEHLEKMFVLIGEEVREAKKSAAQVFEFEKKLAQVSMERVDRRDPEKIYHRIELEGLKKISRQMNWDDYLKTLGFPGIQAINVKSIEFFQGLNQALGETSESTLKAYMKWQLLHAASPGLGQRLVDQEFDFYGRTLSGQKTLAPRWKRCVQATGKYLGFALGRSFVDLTFGEEGKKQAKTMILGIEEAFGKSLSTHPWMDPPTRAQAFEKLAAIFNQVGYPDRWRNYDAYGIDPNLYLKNRFSGEVFNLNYELNKIGKPVDRSEWQMIPSMVNAYYDPSMNEMVFPAGILQPPFFDSQAPLHANYAGIGMVMAHELTHGFDDEGRKFDAQGRLRDWWTPDVSRKFEQGAQCVVQQYDAFELAPGLHVNGKLTTGENIADMGGIKTAYRAWLDQLARLGQKASPQQKKEFFIHFAQTWCAKTRPEMERMRLTIDPHSPPQMRVNGPLSNLPEFSQVFGCRANTPMNPPQRCSLW
ncbi:MAG: M13 family metallopeptidase [Bdellovibrionia bacterium]